MHTWVKSEQQNTIGDGGNTALYTVYTVANLWTSLTQLWDNFETTSGQLWDEFETAFKQFCDLFEENFWDNFRITLRHLTLITLNQFWDSFEKTLGQLWARFWPRWLLVERTCGQNMAIFHKCRVWRLKSYQKKWGFHHQRQRWWFFYPLVVDIVLADVVSREFGRPARSSAVPLLEPQHSKHYHAPKLLGLVYLFTLMPS